MTSIFKEIFGSLFGFQVGMQIRPRRCLWAENGAHFVIGWLPAGELPTLIVCNGKDAAREAIRTTIGTDLVVSTENGNARDTYSNPQTHGPLQDLENSNVPAYADRPPAWIPARFLETIFALSESEECYRAPSDPAPSPKDELVASMVDRYVDGTIDGALLTREDTHAHLYLFFSAEQLRGLVAERPFISEAEAKRLLARAGAASDARSAAYPTPVRLKGNFIERLIRGYRYMHAHLG